MITETKLQKRENYVETVDSFGNRMYKSAPKATTENVIIISESSIFETPICIDDSISVTIIGGGGSMVGTDINGESAVAITRFFTIPSNTKVFVNIGKAGKDGSHGEPSSFGSYLVSNGGRSGVSKKSKPNSFKFRNKEYGRGESVNSLATDGVCIIRYYTAR